MRELQRGAGALEAGWRQPRVGAGDSEVVVLVARDGIIGRVDTGGQAGEQRLGDELAHCLRVNILRRGAPGPRGGVFADKGRAAPGPVVAPVAVRQRVYRLPDPGQAEGEETGRGASNLSKYALVELDVVRSGRLGKKPGHRQVP